MQVVRGATYTDDPSELKAEAASAEHQTHHVQSHFSTYCHKQGITTMATRTGKATF